MICNLTLSILLLFFPVTISLDPKKWLVFWNVGQGSWATFISDHYCLHIDSGGTWRPLTFRCHNKPNILFLTHYDWDHIGFARHLQISSRQLCLWEKTPISIPLWKRKYLEKIPICQKSTIPALKRIYKSQFTRDNESHAYLVADYFLITGDSDRRIEKKFSFHKELKNVRFILAGHHGSRTSLSHELLKSMPSLQMILASCLNERYGHPHKETFEKAKKYHSALLTTELYGSVAFEIP